MDGAPRFADGEPFDPHRLRHLADIDDSGTTDLLYVGDDAVVVCFNQSGNVRSEPHLLLRSRNDPALQERLANERCSDSWFSAAGNWPGRVLASRRR